MFNKCPRLCRSFTSFSISVVRNAGAFAAVAFACALLASSVHAQCPPPNPAPPSVPLAQLRAGQYNVGMDGVLAFAQTPLRSRWLNAGGGAAGAAAVDAYLKARPVPVVVGPAGQLHLVDNHHRTTGVYTLSVEYGAPFPDYIYYRVIADLSNLSGSKFWARLIEGGPVVDENCNPIGTLHHQYLWPYDRGVLQDPNVNPPPMIPGLRDDILRSISANARSANGYVDFEDDETESPPYVVFFQEFYWANFLRDRVFLQGANWETRGGNPHAEFVFHIAPSETEAQATTRLVATAALLCRGPVTMTLPGWTCSADVFADSVINGPDIASVLGAWGSTVAERYKSPTTDANGDGFVDGMDLTIVLHGWGACVN